MPSKRGQIHTTTVVPGLSLSPTREFPWPVATKRCNPGRLQDAAWAVSGLASVFQLWPVPGWAYRVGGLVTTTTSTTHTTLEASGQEVGRLSSSVDLPCLMSLVQLDGLVVGGYGVVSSLIPLPPATHPSYKTPKSIWADDARDRRGRSRERGDGDAQHSALAAPSTELLRCVRRFLRSYIAPWAPTALYMGILCCKTVSWNICYLPTLVWL